MKQRRIYDPGYLETLKRPNVHLTDDPITQVLPHSVLTKSGKEYPADLIVRPSISPDLLLPLYILVLS